MHRQSQRTQQWNHLLELLSLVSEKSIPPQALFAFYQVAARKTEPVVDSTDLPPRVQLYRAMFLVRELEVDTVEHPAVQQAYQAVERCRTLLPDEFLDAVQANLGLIDGERVRGQILRDGPLILSPKDAKELGLKPGVTGPIPGAVVVSSSPAWWQRARGVVHPGGYHGSYLELWEQFLTREERFEALRPGVA